MKHYDILTALRNRHFMDACRRVMKADNGHLTSAIIAQQAAMTRAPHYYISFNYALRILRRMRRGYAHRTGNEAGAMWREIDERVFNLEHRHHISDSEALARVLAEGNASSFFLRPATALRLYHRLKHATKFNQYPL